MPHNQKKNYFLTRSEINAMSADTAPTIPTIKAMPEEISTSVAPPMISATVAKAKTTQDTIFVILLAKKL